MSVDVDVVYRLRELIKKRRTLTREVGSDSEGSILNGVLQAFITS